MHGHVIHATARFPCSVRNRAEETRRRPEEGARQEGQGVQTAEEKKAALDDGPLNFSNEKSGVQEIVGVRTT